LFAEINSFKPNGTSRDVIVKLRNEGISQWFRKTRTASPIRYTEMVSWMISSDVVAEGLGLSDDELQVEGV
jgi:hypothetical protein